MMNVSLQNLKFIPLGLLMSLTPVAPFVNFASAGNSPAVLASRSPQANPSSPILDGTYDMQIKIGNIRFNDEVVIRGKAGPIDISFFSGDIEGSVTVIGSFSADLSGSANCDVRGRRCMLDFSILANENGQQFTVHYAGRINQQDYLNAISSKSQPRFTGTATLDDGSVLGTFEATRRE